MPIIKWKPFKDIHEFFEDLPSWSTMHVSTWDLAADVYEKNNDIIIKLHIPGINLDTISIEIENSHLHVSGSRDEEKEKTEKSYYLKEIRRGSFERVIELPYEVNAEQTTAKVEEGVLIINLPKKEITKGSKKIKIEKK